MTPAVDRSNELAVRVDRRRGELERAEWDVDFQTEEVGRAIDELNRRKERLKQLQEKP